MNQKRAREKLPVVPAERVGDKIDVMLKLFLIFRNLDMKVSAVASDWIVAYNVVGCVFCLLMMLFFSDVSDIHIIWEDLLRLNFNSELLLCKNPPLPTECNPL